MISSYRRPFPRSEATGLAKQSPSLPPPPLPPFTYDYFVGPSGSAANPGTLLAPWSLAHAFDPTNALVVPGVHIGFLSGQYLDATAKRWTKDGTLANPIILRNYNGQHSELINDSASKGPSTIEIAAKHVRFWGFDGWRKNTDRFNYPGPGTNWWIQEGSDDVWLIHCHGHEGSNGLFIDSDVGNIYIYGCFFYHAGVSTDPRAHGLYVHKGRDKQVVGSRLRITDCFSFDHLGNCGQVFASGPPEQLDDIDILRLTCWGGGRKSSTSVQVNLTFGGTDSADIPLRGFTARRIISRNPVGYGSANLRFYGGGTHTTPQDAICEDCYLVGGTSGSGNGRLSIDAMNWSDFQARRNTMINLEQTFLIRTNDTDYSHYSVWEDQHFYGSDPTSLRWRSGPGFTDRTWTGWKGFTGKGDTGGHLDTVQTTLPVATQVFVDPVNNHEYGRGHVIVFNFAALARVPVDLSSFLAVGDNIVVHNVQDLFGAPIQVYDAPVGGNVVTVWTGVPVYIPMTGVNAPPAYGFNNSALNAWVDVFNVVKTAPDFDAFVVTTS